MTDENAENEFARTHRSEFIKAPDINDNMVTLQIDTIDLYQGLRENMLNVERDIKTATAKMLDNIGSRFCQCCFFGHVEGQICGEYLCRECAFELYGYNPETNEMKVRELTYQLWYRKRKYLPIFEAYLHAELGRMKAEQTLEEYMHGKGNKEDK